MNLFHLCGLLGEIGQRLGDLANTGVDVAELRELAEEAHGAASALAGFNDLCDAQEVALRQAGPI